MDISFILYCIKEMDTYKLPVLLSLIPYKLQLCLIGYEMHITKYACGRKLSIVLKCLDSGAKTVWI